MSLPIPNLDDRDFQSIVDDAKRLIPRFCPEWTNHNISDPGVALIEIFAWMSEQVLFRLNQVPDRMYVDFLNLVGVKPFPAVSATARITFWLSAVPEEAVVVWVTHMTGNCHPSNKTLKPDTSRLRGPHGIMVTRNDL